MDDGEVVVHEISDATEADLRHYEELLAMASRLRDATLIGCGWRGAASMRVSKVLTDVCPWCAKIGPHYSGPDDKFHHVVLHADGTWPK